MTDLVTKKNKTPEQFYYTAVYCIKIKYTLFCASYLKLIKLKVRLSDSTVLWDRPSRGNPRH